MIRRNTPSKQAVLNILKTSEFALSQETIEQLLKGSMDRVTVYRILNRLNDDGILHKVLSDDGKQYFALCNSCDTEHHQHDHFHFRCVQCQKVECLDEQVHVTMPEGYVLQSVHCLLTGTCQTCT